MFEPESVILERMNELNPDSNYKGHVPYSPAIEKAVKQFKHIILLLRDPRDVICSMAHAVDKVGGEPINYMAVGGPLSVLSFSERVDYLIENMRPVFNVFNAWRKVEGVKVFYYDFYMAYPDLVIRHLSRMGYGKIKEIQERAQRKAYTYRRAEPCGWIEDMTIEQIGRAGRMYGDLIGEWNPVLEAA